MLQRHDRRGARELYRAFYVTPFLDHNLSITKDSATHYYSQDGLGSVRTLTGSSGVLKNAYGYTAFGKPFASGTSVTVKQRYTYTGRERNPESALMYYRYRQYDARVGRFSGRDPIGYRGGIGLYGYVWNRASGFRDPFGLRHHNTLPWDPYGDDPGPVPETAGGGSPTWQAIRTLAAGRVPMPGSNTICIGVSGYAAAGIGMYGGLYFCFDTCLNTAWRLTLGGGAGMGGGGGIELRYGFGGTPGTTVSDLGGWFFDAEVAIGPLTGGYSFGIGNGQATGVQEVVGGVGAGTPVGYVVGLSHTWLLRKRRGFGYPCCPCWLPDKMPSAAMMRGSLDRVLAEFTDIGFWETVFYGVQEAMARRTAIAVAAARVEAGKLEKHVKFRKCTDLAACGM